MHVVRIENVHNRHVEVGEVCSHPVHEYGYVRVVTDVIADATHDGSTYLSQSARAHHDVRDLLLLCEAAQELARLLVVSHETT